MRRQTRSAEETAAIGEQLAAARPADSGFATLYLAGELGAGKTTLARGFLRRCGISGTVRSPTYTLLEVYEARDLTIVHLDLYRLSGPEELESLGLREWARGGCLWIVEWPERGSGWLPAPDLQVTLRTARQFHEIEVSASSALGESWLRAMYDYTAT